MDEDMKETQCEFCEQFRKCVLLPDPFAHEVYGDMTEWWFCEECYIDRSYEI